jgi:uncharacterized membrane protein
MLRMLHTFVLIGVTALAGRLLVVQLRDGMIVRRGGGVFVSRVTHPVVYWIIMAVQAGGLLAVATLAAFRLGSLPATP